MQQHYQLSQQIGALLKREHWQVSCAESCTGGWISRCITDVPGSSEWFETGFVTYSNSAKHRLLGVPMTCFEGSEAPGAVSEETVTAMAMGALRNARANFSVATSGIAGPDGGSSEKPVGTVWFGWAWQTAEQEIQTQVHMQVFDGNRESVRAQSVTAALQGLLRIIKSQSITDI